MKKLARVDIALPTEGDFLEEVVAAFCAPFPSLAGVRGDDLVEFLVTREMPQRLNDALDKASCNGEWPAAVFLTGENHGGGWDAEELVVRPYTGDRFLRLRDFRNAPVGNDLLAIVDYTQRPSLFAAQEIIEIIEEFPGACYNRPHWVEVDDE